MRLYGLKNCDTCKKAMKSLVAEGNTVEFVDVRADGVTAGDLESFLQAFGDALVNTRSTTWRGLSEAERREPSLMLLQYSPTLMKRPVIQHNEDLFLGWEKDVQSILLGAAP